MPAGAIVAIVIAGILLLILGILFTPLRIRILYDGSELFVTWHLWFLRGVLIPEPQPPVSGKHKKKKKRAALSAAIVPDATTPPPKITDDQAVLLLHFLVDLVSGFYEKFRHKITIKIRTLEMKVGAEDAAHCAILYGVISQAFAYVIEFLDGCFRLTGEDRRNIRIDADFTAPACSFRTDLLLTVPIFRAIPLVVRFLLKELSRGAIEIRPNNANNNQQNGG